MGLGALYRGGLAGTELAVDFLEALLHVVGGILFQGSLNAVVQTKIVPDLLIGAKAQSPEEYGDGDLAVFVDAHIENIVGVVFVFQPSAAVGDHSGAEKLLAGLVILHFVINAGGTNQLGNNHALGAVDDKGAAVRHQGELAHEDFFGLLDLAALLIEKASGDAQSFRIGSIPLLALYHAVIGLFIQLVVNEIQHQIPGKVRNARNIPEHLFQALVQEPLVGILLHLDEVRHFPDLFDAGKAHAGGSAQLHRFDIHHWLNHSIPFIYCSSIPASRSSPGLPADDRDNFFGKHLPFFERCAMLYHSIYRTWHSMMMQYIIL